MDGIKNISLGEQINLTLIHSKKFKSNLVSIYIQRLLDKDEATKNALIPEIVTSGSMKYPSAREISNELDNLYGSSMGADITKRGERQVLSFKIISTNEKYLDENIFKDVIEFFNDIVNNPLVIDGGFKEEFLNIEKQNLKDRIQAKINDKGRYALERAFEEMCQGERYSISEYGYEEDIDKITPKELYEHYKEILRTSPIDIVVEGDFDEDEVIKVITDNFKFERGNIIDIPRDEFIKEIKEVKTVNEKMEITQGKLIMGYRSNIDYLEEEKYFALVVGSNILGGGPDSKLFLNVREKESLCYYVYSSIEKYKGILFISAGIEANNYEKTINLINEQLGKLKNGEISDKELNNSKSALISSMRTIADNIGGRSDFYFAQAMGKTNSTIESIIDKLDKISVEDIVEVVKDIKLDTVYFLSN
ncbi:MULTISPECIES: EF-P 5-aminopentanol modification-associated protein YfmF [unclassified Romboutsia]|uniref:EF-P 5-aminopentanol modification-associated protein YfmF n=1 Tax=unclassified Romboutsia TaxID=2626894 RepID=UPI000822917C|nr:MULTISPECIES: pitrilysin family protein [unclassified Romboutsia]SCH16258.1 Peptidase M16 inactive domain [uncultured Clostridium sp.]